MKECAGKLSFAINLCFKQPLINNIIIIIYLQIKIYSQAVICAIRVYGSKK